MFKPVNIAYIPNDVFLSNITKTSATISWNTKRPDKSLSLLSLSPDLPSLSFFGNQKYTDDKDIGLKEPASYYTHHITVDNLEPGKTYRFGIYHGFKKVRQVRFNTALENLTNQESRVIFGKVVSSDRKGKVAGANIFFRARNASESSTLISTISNEAGQWSMNIGSLLKKDLSSEFLIDGGVRQEITVDATPNGRYELATRSATLQKWPTVVLREKR